MGQYSRSDMKMLVPYSVSKQTKSQVIKPSEGWHID